MKDVDSRFVCGCAVALALLIGAGVARAQQPNIIQLIADDLSWVDLSNSLSAYSNGSGFYQTPNIDRLANEGLSFTHAYAIQNCEPTRAALFTGQYPTRNGVHNVDSLNRNNGGSVLLGANDLDGIVPSAVTLGETLQSAGYTTAHVGKFHATDSAGEITSAHGFNVNIGGTTTGSPDSNYEASSSGVFDGQVGPGMDAYGAPYTQQYVDDNLTPHANGNNPNSIVGDNKHLTDATADAAIDFMDDHLAPNDPFFINVGFHAVHTPINNNVPRDDLKAKWDATTSSDPRHSNQNYAAILEGMDQAIGRIIAFVEDPNGDGDQSDSIAENTIITFVSDNGGHQTMTSNAPLRGHKGTQEEGGLRVPLIVWAPGIIDPVTEGGRTNDEAVHVVDLYPTYAEFAGATLPDAETHALDGESLAGIIQGTESEADRNAVFFHFPGYLEPRARPTSTIVRDFGDERVKLAYFYEEAPHSVTTSYSGVEGAFLMFDLSGVTDTNGNVIDQVDLGENNNLVDRDMTNMQYKRAARATWDLRNFLDETGAVYPTVRATGAAIDAPHHTPRITFDLNGIAEPTLDGATAFATDEQAVTLSMTAVGQNAVFDTNDLGVGVNSDLDGTSPDVERRVDGTLATPEAIEFSFDVDVLLKSILVGGITNSNESMLLEFISGDNPFTGLSGYTGNGFALGSNTLSYTRSSGSGPELVEFGLLDQDEILLTAGTTLAFYANPATSGGVLLDAISVALPIEGVPVYLGDFDGDGEIDGDDMDLVYANAGNAAFDVDLDGDADDDDVQDLVNNLLGSVFGDANTDLKVTLIDLNALGANFNQAAGWAGGDFNGDGTVSLADLNYLGANFGFDGTPDTGPPVFSPSVPEPASLALLALAAATLPTRRRRAA